MARKAKIIDPKFNPKTQKYEKITEKAPKGQRRVGTGKNGKLYIYDDKGNIIGAQG